MLNRRWGNVSSLLHIPVYFHPAVISSISAQRWPNNIPILVQQQRDQVFDVPKPAVQHLSPGNCSQGSLHTESG